MIEPTHLFGSSDSQISWTDSEVHWLQGTLDFAARITEMEDRRRWPEPCMGKERLLALHKQAPARECKSPFAVDRMSLSDVLNFRPPEGEILAESDEAKLSSDDGLNSSVGFKFAPAPLVIPNLNLSISLVVLVSTNDPF
jgi:hypothetical protein